jgi:glycosyltransferase involved in cell wall biosynthesis
VPPEEIQPAETPKVSVVIVSRNRLAALRRTLSALCVPEGPEVVVVDAGSRDGSAGIDSDFPSIRLVKMPRDFGRTRARNIGVRTATGEVVLLLKAGVVIEPAAVERLNAALEGDARAAAAAPRLLDAGGALVPQSFPLPDAVTLAGIGLSGAPLAIDAAAARAEAVRDDALLLRKSFLAGMNYFDEKRFGDAFAELDLFRQIRHAQRDILILDDAPAVIAEPPPTPERLDMLALRACDRITGAAAYIGKCDGPFASISFQIKMFFATLSALLRPSEAKLARRILPGIFSGVKIDGE